MLHTKRTLVLAAVLLAAACKRDAASDARPAKSLTRLDLSDPIDSTTRVAASCDFVKTVANPDPRQLTAEFVRRGAEGEFLQTDQWFETATDCPGHVAGWDSYDIVAAPAIGNSFMRDSVGTVVVAYKRLGNVGPVEDTTGVRGSIMVMRIDTASIADTLALRRTQFGWRIAGRVPPQRVSYQAAFTRGDLKAADTLRIAALLAGWR